jgi:hypothetical protein
MKVFVAHRRLGLASRTFALLETIRRDSDRPRLTPVGNGLLRNSSRLAHSSSEPDDEEAFPCQR